uniref:Glycosyltransferase family 92 protein n=1 Tax=Caenorhabditis tropicalis TaxID=1561998 RepID=A0A1I7TYD0_9PELO
MLPKTKNWKQVKSQLRLPWAIIFLVLSFVCLLFWVFSGGNREDKLFYDEIALMELGEENAFIHSAYFFEDSKSLGKNAVAIVATMHRGAVTDLDEYRIKIVGTNSTKRLVTEAKLSTERDPDESCEYTTVLIQTNTLNSMSKLEIESRNGLVVLPIQTPKQESPKPVVFCIAPLFAAEQWQSFLMQLQVTKKFGAHLHVYMMTMVEYYYQMVRELGELGVISTQPWLSPKFSQVGKPFLEPNRNAELRNPAAAFTDCLLQYKEAAQFIGFMEIEDLLFPVNAQSYYEEFEREYENSLQISALYYQIMEQQSVKFSSPEQQSLGVLLSNAKSGEVFKHGRSVIRPERFNSTWTYFSTQAENQPVILSEEQEEPHYLNRKKILTNAVLRFKNLEYSNEELNATVIPMNPLSSDQQLLKEEHIKEIDEGIKETLLLPTLQEYVKRLPTEDYYSTKLRDCLEIQKHKKGQCVNTKHCNLPNNAKVPCRHSDGLYHSGRVMKPYTYHFVTEYYFTRNLGCYE